MTQAKKKPKAVRLLLRMLPVCVLLVDAWLDTNVVEVTVRLLGLLLARQARLSEGPRARRSPVGPRRQG